MTAKTSDAAAPQADKPAAKAKTPKYTVEQKAIAKAVAEVRGPRSCGPVQVLRVETALAGRDPIKVLDMPLTKAREYAAGSKDVKPSDGLREFSKTEGLCAFSRGRGAAAMLLALGGKLKK